MESHLKNISKMISLTLLVFLVVGNAFALGESQARENQNQVIALPRIQNQSLAKTSKKMEDLVVQGLSDQPLSLQGKALFQVIFSYWSEDFSQSGDRADYKDPVGRYQQTLKKLFSIIPEEELTSRIKNGDLKPLAEYTDEMKDETGAPLSRIEQRYAQVNRALWGLSKPGAASLRRNRAKLRDIIEFVRRFDEALDKLPSFSGHLFRGTALAFAEANDILSGKTKVLSMPPYLSTTLDIGDSFKFINLSRKTKTKMSTLMVIEGTGKLISFLGDFVTEEEILIPRNSKFQIMNAVKINANDEDDPWDWMILFCKQIHE